MNWICWLALALVTAVVPARAWETFRDCRLVEHDGNDGDSFHVQAADRQLVVRLYFVDCPETSAATDADAKRIREQARYFGLTNMTRVIHYGREAQMFVAQLLAKPFTVRTTFATALGRSATPRVYALVTTGEGKDLGTWLVERGYARAHGAKRETPEGVTGDQFAERLKDLEMQAMLHRAGIWSETAADLLAEMRAQQRREDTELQTLREGLREDQARGPVDLNTATSRQLQSIPGVGPVLAARIIAHRPYATVDELLRVPGIRETLLDRLRPHVTVAPAPASPTGS
jgi:DNA uptake protein ComE-like DNA-binding protein